MFIARISRGRTVREFIAGVILVPGTVSLVWFCVLGGLALQAEVESPGVIFDAGGEEAQLFALLKLFPMPTVLSVLVIILLAIFFVTGADSASIIMGTMSQSGSITPRRYATVFWGVMIGSVAGVIMLVGGQDAVDGLRNFTILASSPFVIIIVLLCVAMMRDFRRDPVVVHADKGEELIRSAVVSGASEYGGDFELDVSGAEESSSDEPGDKKTESGDAQE